MRCWMVPAALAMVSACACVVLAVGTAVALAIGFPAAVLGTLALAALGYTILFVFAAILLISLDKKKANKEGGSQ